LKQEWIGRFVKIIDAPPNKIGKVGFVFPIGDDNRFDPDEICVASADGIIGFFKTHQLQFVPLSNYPLSYQLHKAVTAAGG
jgi:hypothetical protein